MVIFIEITKNKCVKRYTSYRKRKSDHTACRLGNGAREDSKL